MQADNVRFTEAQVWHVIHQLARRKSQLRSFVRSNYCRANISVGLETCVDRLEVHGLWWRQAPTSKVRTQSAAVHRRLPRDEPLT